MQATPTLAAATPSGRRLRNYGPLCSLEENATTVEEPVISLATRPARQKARRGRNARDVVTSLQSAVRSRDQLGRSHRWPPDRLIKATAESKHAAWASRTSLQPTKKKTPATLLQPMASAARSSCQNRRRRETRSRLCRCCYIKTQR